MCRLVSMFLICSINGKFYFHFKTHILTILANATKYNNVSARCCVEVIGRGSNPGRDENPSHVIIYFSLL